MENTAQQVKTEVAANVDNQILSDELRNVILKREQYAEQNPDCWIDYEQAMQELRNL